MDDKEIIASTSSVNASASSVNASTSSVNASASSVNASASSVIASEAKQSIIAVVGKMASGKNYISSQLEKEGWASIDADLLVHQAIDQAQTQIIQTFQPYADQASISITKEDGKIDRRALGTILFAHPDLMSKQEAIVYPIITKMIEDFISNHQKIIINATVLFKTPEIMNKCQKILYVKAGLLKRFIRARKRDGLPFKQIIKRFYSQRHLYREYKKSGISLEIVKN